MYKLQNEDFTSYSIGKHITDIIYILANKLKNIISLLQTPYYPCVKQQFNKCLIFF